MYHISLQKSESNSSSSHAMSECFLLFSVVFLFTLKTDSEISSFSAFFMIFNTFFLSTEINFKCSGYYFKYGLKMKSSTLVICVCLSANFFLKFFPLCSNDMKKICSKGLWSFRLGVVLLMAKLLMSEVVVPISQVSSLTLDWLIP